MSVLDTEPPKFTETLVWCERAYNIDIVAKGRVAGLSRDEFVEALDWFYGQDPVNYEHLLELWDETADKYGDVA